MTNFEKLKTKLTVDYFFKVMSGAIQPGADCFFCPANDFCGDLEPVDSETTPAVKFSEYECKQRFSIWADTKNTSVALAPVVQ
ncbi:hypothetical protein FACS1894187_19350 [Synergistales bacterium]|nr:hypothetical protein FACS1894187_19350 [Synergistales bacterium]